MGNAPNGSDDFLPIFGDVTIDYANSKDISANDILVDRVRNPDSGLIRFEINNNLQAGDEIHLNFQTSDSEATTVEVAGENDTMQLALPENMDDQGKYTAKFIVADEVNIDLRRYSPRAVLRRRETEGE